MNIRIRQYSIIITSLYAYAAFTVINPFYPAIAARCGIPLSLIGFIISIFPIASIIISFLLPNIMFKAGRNIILIFGLLLIGSSLTLISVIENNNTTIAIIISIFSRILSGAGSGCVIVGSNSILSSDYPEDYQRLAALIEVFSGLGLIIGPFIGSLLFPLGGFKWSCIGIGLFVFGYIPVIVLILGKSRTYVIKEKAKISVWELSKKPKVTLNAIMGLCIMFAVGITMPTLEPHILSYGIDEQYIGFWYIIYTGGYFICSLIMTRFNKFPRQKTMFFGLIVLIVSMVLLGPCPYLFDRNVVLAGVGHHLMGWAISIMYSKSYLVPLIPYLIDICHNEYKIPNDDRLNDSLSSIVNIASCIGQVVGPITGSLLLELFESSIKYRATFMMASFIFTVYAIFYIIINCLLSRKGKKRLNSSPETELLENF